jgi:phosphoglycolate phosphatase-like HAD superfamily hydrolase
MQEAGKRVAGGAFTLENVEFAGRLDPLIFRDGLRGVEGDGYERHHAAFRRAYEEGLARRLAEPGLAAPLPGVMELLERLRHHADLTLGLVTGNYPETGRIKLHAAGIEPAWFEIPVWGIDGPTRRDLPAAAMARFAERKGTTIAPRRVVVIGDTPHDIDCAHHNGCVALAVATGPSFSRADLEAHEPEHLVDDLRDTDAIEAWLGGISTAGA